MILRTSKICNFSMVFRRFRAATFSVSVLTKNVSNKYRLRDIHCRKTGAHGEVGAIFRMEKAFTEIKKKS